MTDPTTAVRHRYLMNFSASYSGGGYKRLHEFAKWFDANGGAWFIIHPKSAALRMQFPRNRYWIADLPRYKRLFNDCAYLGAIVAEIGEPELYYSYGIPIYSRVGKKNWFHLSNVLPLLTSGIPLSLFDRLKMRLVGRRVKGNLQHADIVSAESQFSLGLVPAGSKAVRVVSVNGSDEELEFLKTRSSQPRRRIAAVVGTYGYKALQDSHRVFEMLRGSEPELKLVIIGAPEMIPDAVRRAPGVEVKGTVPRDEVIGTLRAARYYISTTYIENSFNAASEGVSLAGESYISDIPPHRELLKGIPFSEETIPGVARPMLHVQGGAMTAANLKSWDEVVRDMISTVGDAPVR